MSFNRQRTNRAIHVCAVGNLKNPKVGNRFLHKADDGKVSIHDGSGLDTFLWVCKWPSSVLESQEGGS